MSWTDSLWWGCCYATDLVVLGAAELLDRGGSLLCFASGVGFTGSYAMEATADVSYYGSANTGGHTAFGVKVSPFNLYFNDTFYLSRYDEMQWGGTYKSTDYLDPYFIRVGAAICLSVGSVIKLVGTNLKLFRLGVRDKWYDGSNQEPTLELSDIHVPSHRYAPKLKEHALVSVGSLLDSLSSASFGCALTGITISGLGFLGSSKTYSYPSEGPTVNGTYYKGPVQSMLVPFEYSVARNISLTWTLPTFNITLPAPYRPYLPFKPSTLSLPIQEFFIVLNILGKAMGSMNAIYGGGVTLKSVGKPVDSLTISGSIVAPFTFFASQALSNAVTDSLDMRKKEAKRELKITV